MADMTRNEYWKEVASLANIISTEALDGFDKAEQAEILEYDDPTDHDGYREALYERTWEIIDGHKWVIYTAYNYDVMRFSDNGGYSAENFGAESIIKDGVLNTGAIAFGALYGDVTQHSDYGKLSEDD